MPPTADALLNDLAWLRRLAMRLATDRDDADDLVQDTWIALWQRAPAEDRSLRPWLAKVMRDLAKMRRRGEARRTAREATVPADEHVATSEDLLVQARLYRLVVELVLELDEPYRGTVLAHYVEGTTCAELARRAKLPEATVRWRLAEAIRRLRDALDARSRRRRWLLVPMFASKLKVGAAIVVVALALLALLLMLGPFGTSRGSRGGGSNGPRVFPAPAASITDPRTAAVRTASWLLPADVNTHAIVGHVVDERGAPIAGALVQLQSWGSPDANAPSTDDDHTTTATDGRFRLVPRWSTRAFVTASAVDHAAETVGVDPRTLRESDDVVIVVADCTRAIEGVITDAGGGPIAGSTIRRLPPNAIGPSGPRVASGPDGRYRMCTRAGHAWFEIGADGYEHVLREVDVHGRHRIDVALVPGASVEGRVVEAGTNRPLANVQIGLWPIIRRSGEASERGAISDGDGHFIIDGLAVNRYQLTAWDRDHARTVIDEVAIEVGRQPRQLVVRMEPGVEVAGHVVSNDAHVAGARVTFQVGSIAAARHFGGTAASTFEVVTAPDGGFVLHGVPRADTVIPSVAGYTVRAPASIDTRQTVAHVEIDVTRLATLHGHVVRDGIRVPNAHLSATRTAGEIATADADGHGAFELTGLLAGTYRIVASSDRMGAFTIDPIVVDVPHDAPLEIELDGGATITGTVVGETGAPIVGAIVEARRDVGEDSGTALTDTTGAFTIDSLAGGDYALSVLARRGAPRPLRWSGPAPAPIHLAGGHAHAGPLTLAVIDTEHTISGTVVDHDHSPVPDAIVRLGPTTGSGEVPIARTTTDGRFTFTVRGDGPFMLDAGTGTGPRATLRDVRAGATDLVIELVTPGTIDVTLDGLPDARLTLRSITGLDGAASARNLRTTNADGNHAVFDGLMPGDYVITAMTPQTANETATAHLDAGATVHVTLRAHATRTLYGRVTRIGDDAPIAGIACVAAAATTDDTIPPGLSGIGVPRTSTDASGNFAIANAPAGDAIVVCYGGAYSRTDVSNGATRVAPGAIASVRVAPIISPWHDPGFEVDGGHLSTHVTTVDGVPLLPGDIIIAVDGIDVRAIYSQAVFWLAAAHTKSSLRILRGGVELAAETR